MARQYIGGIGNDVQRKADEMEKKEKNARKSKRKIEKEEEKNRS